MPLELVTGTPGNGKTSFIVSRLLKYSKQKDFNRHIVIIGIHDLDIPDLDIQLSDYEECKEWNNGVYPDGSLIIVDECQNIFPQRSASKEPPSYITDLSIHRHKGFDFVFITQDPRLLDVWIRRNVAEHRHIKRLFGSMFQVVFLWTDKACDAPRDKREQSTAIKSIKRLDKKSFGRYRSASEHTIKRKVPFKVISFVIFILSFPFVAWYFGMNIPFISQEKTKSLEIKKQDSIRTQLNNTKSVANRVRFGGGTGGSYVKKQFFDSKFEYRGYLKLNKKMPVELYLYNHDDDGSHLVNSDILKFYGIDIDKLTPDYIVLKKGSSKRLLSKIKDTTKKYSSRYSGLSNPFQTANSATKLKP